MQNTTFSMILTNSIIFHTKIYGENVSTTEFHRKTRWKLRCARDSSCHPKIVEPTLDDLTLVESNRNTSKNPIEVKKCLKFILSFHSRGTNTGTNLRQVENNRNQSKNLNCTPASHQPNQMSVNTR